MSLCSSQPKTKRQRLKPLETFQTQQQTAARTTCHHVVWVFLYLFKISENGQLLAQTDIGVSSFQCFLNQMFHSISNALKIINNGVREYKRKLRDHEKFDIPQTWYVSGKNASRPSRCSSCLQPKKIIPGDIHF